VRAARSGEQALRAAASEPRPDLVLLDVMMPEMDGYAVLARLRQEPATAATPVIFVTALADIDNEQKGLDLGAVDYLSKPLSPAILLARVRVQLELKAARDALASQNALLEAKVQARTAELERALAAQQQAHEQLRQTFFSMVQVFASLLELRGSGLAGHARRVTEVARRIGKRIGLEGKEFQEMVVAAILHDIGKMILPDHLLDCPLEQMTAENGRPTCAMPTGAPRP
jgi:putative two-component system response regulator